MRGAVKAVNRGGAVFLKGLARHLACLLLPITLLCVNGCSSREVVVVYSPHGPEMLKDAEAEFEKANPNVDVQWLDMGSQDVYNRISAERNRPAADVWWGGSSTMFTKAADDGLLEPYRPAWTDAVPAEFKDPKDRWYGTYRSPLAIMFNTRRYTRETVPHTWDELLNPEWKGKLTLRKPPASGSMRVFLGAMILRAPDETAGFDWLRRLHEATESYPESPQFLFDHLRKDEALLSVWLMADVALQRERNGYPFDCVVPEGTPVLTEGIALVAHAPHPDWAKRFYEFVTSREALPRHAAAYAKIPVRNDIDPAALPGWMRDAVAQLKPMAIDWAAFSGKEQAWCDRWEKEVYRTR